MPGDAPRAEWTDYSLVDAGELRRLERFGPVLIDRPAQTAADWRRDPTSWAGADLRFDLGQGWSSPKRRGAAIDLVTFEPWAVSIDGLLMEVRPTESGGIGLYPEHTANLVWLDDRVRERTAAGEAPSILNLFAHTGLLTLAAARAGGTVTHVDGARTAVAWARRNAELSGLTDRPLRWLVDDAIGFVKREARRGRRYDGIVLDPPSFGRAKGRRWRLAEELPNLLAACREVSAEDAFVLLTAHTTGFDGERMADAIATAFGGAPRPDVAPLRLVAESHASLDLGWSVRLTR